MLEIILLMSLANPTNPGAQQAQFQPCVWPNKCERPAVAQFQPCVWPNRCEKPHIG